MFMITDVSSNLNKWDCRFFSLNDKLLLYNDLVKLNPMIELVKSSIINHLVFGISSDTLKKREDITEIDFLFQAIFGEDCKNLRNSLDFVMGDLIRHFPFIIPFIDKSCCVISYINKKDILDTVFYDKAKSNLFTNYDFERIYLIHGVFPKDAKRQLDNFEDKRSMVYQSLFYYNLVTLVDYYLDYRRKEQGENIINDRNLLAETLSHFEVNIRPTPTLLDEIFDPYLRYNTSQIKSLIKSRYISQDEFEKRLKQECYKKLFTMDVWKQYEILQSSQLIKSN